MVGDPLMSGSLILTALLLVNLLALPLLLAGCIRKVKAWMQNRTGPPLLQPWYDVAKLLRKSQTVSAGASWVFSLAPQVGLAVVACAAVLVPWNGAILPPSWAVASNLLLVLYLLALARFLALLAALDTGSAFGGLGASREAAVSVMVEPILVLALGALALSAGSMNLLAIYAAPISPWLAAAAGTALLLAAMAELSRMPVDDPTTHLELTMIHEAMILEYSGPSLAAIEYTVALRGCIFLGLAMQTLLHIWPAYSALPVLSRYAVSVAGLVALGVALAVVEGVWVKLNWRKVPNFLGYAAILSLLAVLIAAVRG
jgi:formate hydrogenlyase subunit 4